MVGSLAFIQEIDRTLAQSSSDKCAGMLRRLTDYFIVGSDNYSDHEIAIIDEVFVRLVATIEESARALLAIRLAPVLKAPPKILRILACDNAIEVASPVLIQSERLDESSLIECAKTNSQEHLLAISCRKTLAEAVTDILVVRGDQQVVLSAAQNAGAKFSNQGFTILVKRSNGDDRLALAVGIRPDIPRQLFQQLLQLASETVRVKLEAESPSAKRDIHRVVNDVTSRIRANAATQMPERAAAQVLVTSLREAGQLNIAKLNTFATSDQFDELVFALALLTELPADFVEGAMSDAHTESLLVLCKAIGLPKETVRNILTLCSREHLRSEREVEQSMVAFQRLTQSTAQQILKFRRKQQRPESKAARPN